MATLKVDPNLMTDKERVSYGRLLYIALPLMVQGLSITIMTTIGRIFLSHYDVSQLAALTPAFYVGFSIGAFFNGIVWYIITLTTQYLGAGHKDKLKLPMWQGIIFSCFGALCLFFIMPFADHIFGLFKHDANLIKYETSYLNLFLGSVIVGLFWESIGGYFAGTGRTVVLMCASLAGNISSIFFDWWLIFGHFGVPALGITGAGSGIFLGSLVTLTVMITALIVDSQKGIGREIKVLRPKASADVFKRLMVFGLPAAAQLTIDSFGFTILLLFMGKIGWAPTAAAGIVLTLQMFAYLPIINIAIGCGIIVGQERGAGRFYNIKTIIKKTKIFAGSLGGVIALSLLIWTDVLVLPFMDAQQPEQIMAIQKFIKPMISIAATWIVLEAILNAYLHSLKALGDTMFIMGSYLIGTPITMILPAWIITSKIKDPVLLLSMVLFFVVSLLTALALRFRSNAWKKKHVIATQDEGHAEGC